MLDATQRSATLIAEATKRVQGMDEHDGHSMAEIDSATALRTVMSALDCGMGTQDWGCVGDAYVMLRQIVDRVRKDSSLSPLNWSRQ